MTSEQTTTTPMLVFKSEAGDYFLLPRELLERGRVPEGRKAELAQLIEEQGDVQAYDTQSGLRDLVTLVGVLAGGIAGLSIGSTVVDRAGLTKELRGPLKGHGQT
jgi:hypothetical protein